MSWGVGFLRPVLHRRASSSPGPFAYFERRHNPAMVDLRPLELVPW